MSHSKKWEPFQGATWGKSWIMAGTVQASPWATPPTLKAALSTFENKAAVWLSEALDVMAFGTEKVPDHPVEAAVRRTQASKGLCQAARSGLVQMFGAANHQCDANDPIPRAYFDIPRQIGSDANSLDVFSDPISDDEFYGVGDNGGYQKWFNVRIETSSLLDWLRSVVRTDAPQGAPDYNVMERHGNGKIHNLVFNAMEEIWPDHRVPKSLGIKDIARKIEKGLQQRNVRKADDEIRRILGLKK
jgi:hypothetical protein